MHWTPAHRRNAGHFAAELRRNGFDFFTGVPCSLLGALLEELEEYLPSSREDAALGMACGAYLGGRLPVVLMQNSGLGYCLNVMTSLNLIYKIPVLCLISFRGLGPDAPEHLVMGRSCRRILDAIGVAWCVPGAPALSSALSQAKKKLIAEKKPQVIFIKRGIFGQ